MWPDWSGKTALIVGTGPSATAAPLNIAKGLAKAIVIKQSWHLAPWADVLYGIDKGWWIAHHGAPKFPGLKVSPSPTACRVYRLRQVTLRPFADILTRGEVGVIGCGLRTGGGFSGFQAINLAVQFGAKRIILVGFDMNLAAGAHWNSDERGVGRADKNRTESWRKSLDAAAPQLEELGVEVVNTSAKSSLKSFKIMSLEEALHGSENSGRRGQSELRPDHEGDVVAGSAVPDLC